MIPIQHAGVKEQLATDPSPIRQRKLVLRVH